MYIVWALAGIIFLLADLKKKSPLMLTFSAVCLFSSIGVFKFNYNLLTQAVAAFSLFFVFYFLIKTIFKKEENELKTLDILKNSLGKIATVKKDIGKTLSIDGIGTVELENVCFSAKSVSDKEIKAGNKVKIVSRENSILNVELTEEKV